MNKGNVNFGAVLLAKATFSLIILGGLYFGFNDYLKIYGCLGILVAIILTFKQIKTVGKLFGYINYPFVFISDTLLWPAAIMADIGKSERTVAKG